MAVIPVFETDLIEYILTDDETASVEDDLFIEDALNEDDELNELFLIDIFTIED